MKLRELIQLNEGATTIQGDVDRLDQLRGKDSEFLVGIVNVTGDVNLHGQKLQRLPVQFGTVGRFFDCSSNQLTSLEDAPSTVGEDFNCNNNRLTSLEDAPSTVGGYFLCRNNRLTSLVGVHRILRRIGGTLSIKGNPIASGGIGLILVEGLAGIVADQPAFEIINGFLGQGNKGVLRCQEALHDAGYGEFAKP